MIRPSQLPPESQVHCDNLYSDARARVDADPRISADVVSSMLERVEDLYGRFLREVLDKIDNINYRLTAAISFDPESICKDFRIPGLMFDQQVHLRKLASARFMQLRADRIRDLRRLVSKF